MNIKNHASIANEIFRHAYVLIRSLGGKRDGENEIRFFFINACCHLISIVTIAVVGDYRKDFQIFRR